MMNDVTLKQIAAVKATVHTGSHIWRSSLGSAAKYAPFHRWRLYKIAHCYKRTAPMNQTDSMLDPTGSGRMRPAQTWWAGRSWRADRVGRDRERICRIATRRDAMPKKQLATPAMPGGRAYD